MGILGAQTVRWTVCGAKAGAGAPVGPQGRALPGQGFEPPQLHHLPRRFTAAGNLLRHCSRGADERELVPLIVRSVERASHHDCFRRPAPLIKRRRWGARALAGEAGTGVPVAQGERCPGKAPVAPGQGASVPIWLLIISGLVSFSGGLWGVFLAAIFCHFRLWLWAAAESAPSALWFRFDVFSRLTPTVPRIIAGATVLTVHPVRGWRNW